MKGLRLGGSSTRSTGNKGEDIACVFLTNKGYKIKDRNYYRKWGELDIVAQKGGAVHFFEVKSVTYTDSFAGDNKDIHRPEDNIHALKLKHTRRAIESYLSDKWGGKDVEFYFHVICVYMNRVSRRANVKMIENIVL